LEEKSMARTSPWHSTKPGTKVYHDNTDCPEGNNIEHKYSAPGKGGKRKCKRCKKLGRKR
jgi:hypothetical protein